MSNAQEVRVSMRRQSSGNHYEDRFWVKAWNGQPCCIPGHVTVEAAAKCWAKVYDPAMTEPTNPTEPVNPSPVLDAPVEAPVSVPEPSEPAVTPEMAPDATPAETDAPKAS